MRIERRAPHLFQWDIAMSFYDDRARARAAALMLRGMLRELRSAPKDSRDFLVFDKRDDWKDLGVNDDHVAAFDLSDDALLDHHIAQAGEAVRAFGACRRG